MLRSLLLAASAALLVNAVNDFSSLSCLVESKGVHVPGTVPCNPHEPLQHRLAYGGPDGMMVSWSTHARLDVPTVWYGESPLSLSNEATGYSVTYPTSRVHDNHVKLTGLKPHTKYWYRTSFQLRPAFHSVVVLSTSFLAQKLRWMCLQIHGNLYDGTFGW
jgi:acid phosphatase type 7